MIQSAANLPRRAALLTLLLLSMSAQAGADIVLTVPGTSDPWLAGMPAGSKASSGDTAPAQSPTLVPGSPGPAGNLITFQASGAVSHGPGFPEQGPEGNVASILSHDAGAQNGIASIKAPVDSLIGVFLGEDRPDSSAAPIGLDFSTAASRDYLTLAPALKQVFYIGDGFTSSGLLQQIVVPDGAVRLYLGTMDGYGWYNNSGSFQVRIGGMSAVPEPSSIVALSTALAVLSCASAKRFARDLTPRRS